MGLKRAEWTHVGLILIPLSCVSGITDQEECEYTCKALEKCGLLPSMLGAESADATARANCIERCERTPESGREEIQACARDSTIKERDWCIRTGACSEFSACLRGKFPEVPITGLASLQVEAWKSCAVSPNVELAKECKETELVRCPWSTNAVGQCQTRSDYVIRAFVSLAEGRIFGPARDCAAGLSRHTAFDELPPGLLEVGIRVLGSPSQVSLDDASGGAAGVSMSVRDCREFKNFVELPAGTKSALVPVLVDFDGTDGTTCEVCDDAADNDGDRLIDCDDGDCTLDCERISPLVADGGAPSELP